jgi:hypothetical protein
MDKNCVGTCRRSQRNRQIDRKDFNRKNWAAAVKSEPPLKDRSRQLKAGDRLISF